jgi:hypothetical protein
MAQQPVVVGLRKLRPKPSLMNRPGLQTEVPRTRKKIRRQKPIETIERQKRDHAGSAPLRTMNPDWFDARSKS